MNSIKSNSIIIATGDPAGIGTEIILKALYELKGLKTLDTIIVGCKENINSEYINLREKGINNVINPKDLNILDIPINKKITERRASAATGNASFKWLQKSVSLLKKTKAKALVTAPISKYAWHQAGHFYPGQTELLAELSNAKEVSMLFTATSPNNGWRLNTLLATTHIPISQISSDLTPEKIHSKLNTLLSFCKRFKEKPKLAIAGLNPHSGEQGQLGNEEQEWLIPTMNKWKALHPTIELDGPIPPDTCWIPSANAWEGKTDARIHDGILAMYHDQALIPVKLIAFDYAVNTTLGLPFIRTSPDHGTGFDIAGKGLARHISMKEAIRAALELSAKD